MVWYNPEVDFLEKVLWLSRSTIPDAYGAYTSIFFGAVLGFYCRSINLAPSPCTCIYGAQHCGIDKRQYPIFYHTHSHLSNFVVVQLSSRTTH
jgi:hypothetical protein